MVRTYDIVLKVTTLLVYSINRVDRLLATSMLNNYHKSETNQIIKTRHSKLKPRSYTILKVKINCSKCVLNSKVDKENLFQYKDVI